MTPNGSAWEIPVMAQSGHHGLVVWYTTIDWKMPRPNAAVTLTAMDSRRPMTAAASAGTIARM